jgi:hypothetical protein
MDIIRGLAGTATCAETLSIFQSKDNERKRQTQEKAAKDEERESIRRRNVVGAMTKALTLLEEVVQAALAWLSPSAWRN